MNENTTGKLLRIFIGESDRWEHGPLYEAMVEDGLITLESVEVVRYRASSAKKRG